MPGFVLASEDLAEILAKYVCTVCGLLLRSPVQAECGHHFCTSCVNHMLTSSEMDCKCQKDGTKISKRTVFPDAFVNREIMALVVPCLHKGFGCNWKGVIREYEDHVAECAWEPVNCVYPGCGKLMSRAVLSEHLGKECPYRPVECSYCKNQVTCSEMEEHQQTACPKFVIPCTLCKVRQLPRDEISHHQNPLTGDCPELEAPCCFVPMGCPNKEIMKLDQRKKHEESTVPAHLRFLLRFCFQIREQLGSALSGLVPAGEGVGFYQALKQKVWDLASMVSSTAAEVQETKEKVLQQDHRISELERDKVGSVENSERSDADNQGSGRQQLDNMRAKTADHEVLIEELNRNLIDCRSTIDSLKRRVEALEDKNIRLTRRVESNDHMLAIRNVAQADLEQLVQQQQESSYDGTLLWRITDFAKKKQEAISGKQPSFYSPFFYTSRHGYKMCARIYLNGDGMGRGTHISVFFTVMRGQYDALLRWPFRQKVTIMLLDQDNVEHVIDAFRPDPNSASFQRPRREMNVASGCPLFCGLVELNKHAYVRDDTMFLKVTVDPHFL